MSKPKLTLSMINQLISYCDKESREGWYYGDKKSFNKRHDSIVEWLENHPIKVYSEIGRKRKP